MDLSDLFRLRGWQCPPRGYALHTHDRGAERSNVAKPERGALYARDDIERQFRWQPSERTVYVFDEHGWETTRISLTQKVPWQDLPST